MKNSSYVETITPDMAAKWLGQNYRHQRPLKASWVDHLAEEMEEGRFQPTALIHFAVNQDGTTDLLNGQHTLHAIVKSGKNIVATVLRSNEVTDQQVLNMYATGHDLQRRRSFKDSAIAWGVPDQMGLSPSDVEQIYRAIQFGRRNFGTLSIRQIKHLSVPTLIEWVKRWEPEAKQINATMQGTAAGKLVRIAAVYPVALVTFYYQPETARSFWPAAMTCDGVSRGDPRYTLYQYLSNLPTAQPGSPSDKNVGKRDASSIMTRKVMHAWNAFSEGRSLLLVRTYIDRVYDPPIIVGTQFNGQQSPEFWPTRNLG